jgi:hypothetical protein
MAMITVTFDPDEVFVLGDLQRDFGITQQSVNQWWQLHKDDLPEPLLRKPFRIWTAEQGRLIKSKYAKDRERKGYR